MNHLAERVKSPDDIFLDHYDEIMARDGRGKALSFLSLPQLDDRIWGLPKKSLVVVGGRPSMGKSTLMLQMAWDFARGGKKVLFITLEMTAEECVERLWSMDQEIDNFWLISGKINKVKDTTCIKDKRDAFYNQLGTAKLTFVENYGKTFAEINDVISSTNKGEYDAVFIDYLQMIKEKTNSKTAIDEYIKDLRSYAIKKNFCAIVGSQINRGSHDQHKIREPEMYELKGSGSIEEHCDVCILVHWPWFYSRDKGIGEKEKYLVKVCKNRRGRSGRFNCKFEPEYFRVSEYPQAPDEGVGRVRKDLD